MVWDTPLEDVDTSNLSGFETVKPGGYHVMVQNVEFDAKNQMVVDYEIMHGTLTSEIGKTHRDYFSPSPKAVGRALQFAVAAGVTSEEELEELKRQRRTFNRYKEAIGKHLKIELERDVYNGKERSKCGFGIFALNNPKVANIPVNKGVLEQSGESDPFSGGGAAANEVADEDPFAEKP